MKNNKIGEEGGKAILESFDLNTTIIKLGLGFSFLPYFFLYFFIINTQIYFNRE